MAGCHAHDWDEGGCQACIVEPDHSGCVLAMAPRNSVVLPPSSSLFSLFSSSCSSRSPLSPPPLSPPLSPLSSPPLSLLSPLSSSLLSSPISAPLLPPPSLPPSLAISGASASQSVRSQISSISLWDHDLYPSRYRRRAEGCDAAARRRTTEIARTEPRGPFHQ